MKTAISLLAVLSFSFALSAQEKSGNVSFNEHIRPILSENCFKCHGPDEESRESKLRLDQREAAVQRKAIVPRKPDESELIARIMTNDPDDIMPPLAAKKPLTTREKELLREWIASGAEYQEHWAFVPPRSPAIPKVKEKRWPKNEIVRAMPCA